MVTPRELEWAAGFILGEGHFPPAVPGKTGASIRVGQKEKEPLLELQRIFGGNIYTEKGHVYGLWRWSLNGARAAGVMMTLFPLMLQRSPKRVHEIKHALTMWKLCKKQRRVF